MSQNVTISTGAGPVATGTPGSSPATALPTPRILMSSTTIGRTGSVKPNSVKYLKYKCIITDHDFSNLPNNYFYKYFINFPFKAFELSKI